MTILGRGDLSPPRRHRRLGPVVATVLVVAVLLVAGWFGWNALRGHGGGKHAAARTCVTPTAAPTPAAPAEVTVAVLNATQKVGLAHRVAAALRARGFRVGHIGNTKAQVTGTAVVTFGPGAGGAATAVAEQLPGAVVSPASTGGVTLEIGPAFTALAAPAAVAAAHSRDLASASPRPPVCSSR